jgi:glycosyltransferase involved in cell wall biosynthesis
MSTSPPQPAPTREAPSPELSIIVPLYNEEENVAPLYDAIVAALRPLSRRAEILLVDDGSRDATFVRAVALPRLAEPRLRLVRLRRNYGQTAAMTAGIREARGAVLVTMDGDLQNDPLDIPRFLERIEAGFDLVVGWRKDRKDHWSRVLPSRIANWLIGKVTGVPIKDNGCSLKAYRASFIKEIPLYAEMHRFIPAMSSLAAPRIAEIEVRHHPRRFGSSKYGFSRIYKVFVDLLVIRTIVSFARRPELWLAAGAALSVLAALIAISAMLAMALADGGTIVFQGLAVLTGALAIFLIFLALLNQLVYSTRTGRLHRFAWLAARRIDDGVIQEPLA